MPRELLSVGFGCLAAAAALWFLTADLTVSGLLALLGVVLLFLGVPPSEYDEEAGTDEGIDREE